MLLSPYSNGKTIQAQQPVTPKFKKIIFVILDTKKGEAEPLPGMKIS